MSTIQYDLNLESELPEEFKIIATRNGECEETKSQVIEEFRNYIAEHNESPIHRTDDAYLMKFLRARLWKIPASYQLLCNYYKFREENKSYYEKVRPLDYAYIADSDIISVAPHRDQNGHRILFFRFGNWNPQQISVDDLFRVSIIMMEVGSLEPISQVVGGIAIYDLENLALNQVLQLTPSVAKKMISLLVSSMPISTKALHIVNTNPAFKIAFKLFKPFLNVRMRESLFIHSNVESLHDHINPEYLPKRYGGIHEDYSHQQWLENIRDNKRIREELQQLGYAFE